MNPRDRIREDLNSREGRQGMGSKVVVTASALRELLLDYDRMDAMYRAASAPVEVLSPGHYLELALHNMVLRHGAETTMLAVMETLTRYINDTRKDREVDRRFDRR